MSKADEERRRHEYLLIEITDVLLGTVPTDYYAVTPEFRHLI